MPKHVINKTTQQNARNARFLKAMVVCICFVLAFAAGFFVRGDIALLTRLGFNTSAPDTIINPGTTVTGNTFDSVSARVAEVEGILLSESLDSYDLDDTTNNVLSSFVQSTEDPYLRYYNAARYATYVKDTATTYAGVGVLFAEYNGKSYAADVFADSEARAKGVSEGDFVVAIDGDRGDNGWSLVETIKAIARDEGSSVVVTWRRPSSIDAEGGQEFTTTLTCSSYVEPNVSSELIDDSVGYIKVTQFTRTSTSIVQQDIADLTSRGATSFVLDLRDNPGGYLTQSVDIASLFVKSGVIVEIESKTGVTNKTATGTTATEAPLVVVMNGNTAAAAEVLAAALQDNNRATLVGAQTMGKGTVQSIRELSFGGALRYTSAQYKAPQGHAIADGGVTPDIRVENNADSPDDSQRAVAVETAQSLANR